jgi:hypothetical protein
MRLFVLFFSLCFSVSVFAQNYDFGKVSKEELQEKFNPLDSSASATYLYKNRKTFFEYRQEKGFELVTEIQERIKIYNKEGFEYATKKVYLHKSGSDEEQINSLKAYTYNLIDGKIEETKLDKNGIFDTEQSKYRNETKFTMPDIKEGSIIEYKYKIYSPFYWSVDDFVFQFDIPVKKMEAIFETPEYFNFKVNMKGFFSIKPKNETKRGVITLNNKTRTVTGGFSATQTTFSSSNIEFTNNISTYNLDNVPALKEEPFVNNINNYRSTIQYELSYTNFPQTPIKYYSTTWEDVVKTIYENPNFGGELDKTGYFEKDIDAIIGSISDPVARVALIYDFVKAKVKWNGYYSKYCDDGVRKAYKEQVGNVAEINLMLTSMLRYAGIKAFPILVSTRQNGIPIFPTREGYNYVVTYVNLPTGVVYLDATNKYSAPNILPFRTLNWQGRVMAEHGGSELIDLFPKEASKNTTYLMVNMDNQGAIKGDLRTIKTNHSAMLYREEYVETNKEQYLEKLENKYKGMEISDFKVDNESDLSKPVMETYKFEKDNQADIIGDKIYFSPLLFLKTTENPFKLEKREFPIDFGFPTFTQYMMVINIPDGFKIETLPKPAVLALPDQLGSYKYNLTFNDNTIQVIIESKITQPIISSLYYESLKAYFSKIIETEAEPIVLTKV